MRIEKHSGMHQAHKADEAAKELAKIHEKLATGKKLNRASDDAAGVAVAADFEKRIRAFRNAGQNLAAGASAMSIADGGASSITDMLQRQRELAIQSANGTVNDDQRQAIDKEFQALSQEIERTGKSTQYNGQNLLDGSSKLSDGTGKLGDGGQGIDLPHTDLSLASLSMGTQRVDTLDGAQQALNAIDSAMKEVGGARSENGALGNRLEHALRNLDNQMVNTANGLANIQDLDFAKASTEKMRASILQESNAAALTQFNNLSRTHLLALLQ